MGTKMLASFLITVTQQVTREDGCVIGATKYLALLKTIKTFCYEWQIMCAGK
jgi:hypothetical protein